MANESQKDREELRFLKKVAEEFARENFDAMKKEANYAMMNFREGKAAAYTLIAQAIAEYLGEEADL